MIRFIFFLFLPLVAFAQFGAHFENEGATREREFDIQNILLHISFNERAKSVTGEVTHTIVPLSSQASSISFDEGEMNFSSVKAERVGTPAKKLSAKERTVTVTSFDTSQGKLHIHFGEPLSSRDTVTVTITYSCTPKSGMYFIAPSETYPHKPNQIWTQGEAEENRYWIPCYDYPNDKATTEAFITVKNSYVALSNGKLIDTKDDPKAKTKIFHWKESLPYSSYLMMIGVGEYSILHDKWKNIPLEYYTYPGKEEDARRAFALTPDMMDFFSKQIGFDYPWEKYAQIPIADFMYGGMENVTATTLNDKRTLIDRRTEKEYTAQGLLAHELAHQWWGDVVTCRDWRHLWLNEGFASYFEALYNEHHRGRDEFEYEMKGVGENVLRGERFAGREKAVVAVDNHNFNIYDKGSCVLHMLRHVVGDETFWRALNYYITRHKFSSVETNDLKLAIEDATGKNLAWFFDQWVYNSGHPKFDVSSSYDTSANALSLTVRQTQTLDSLTGIFTMPVDVEIISAGERRTETIMIDSVSKTFTFSHVGIPTAIVFDKGGYIIPKELKFPQSREALLWLTEHGDRITDRTWAINEFVNADSLTSYENDSLIIAALLDRARNDMFWGVRLEAVNALTRIAPNNSKVLTLVRSRLEFEPEARVRLTLLGIVRKARDTTFVAQVKNILRNDSSYAVSASAITTLVALDSVHSLEVITPYAKLDAFRDAYRNAVLDALPKLHAGERGIRIAKELVTRGATDNRPTRLNALSTLEELAPKNEITSAFVLELATSDDDVSVRRAAAHSLEKIGTEKIIPQLESLKEKEQEKSVREAIVKTIEVLKKKS